MSIELEREISDIKSVFKRFLCEALKLDSVQGPLFLSESSGLNDHLCSVERPVTFDTKSGEHFEVIHSLAKWKRMALSKFNTSGIVTDMRAIRRDELLDDTHSYLVDQWDWEMKMNARSIEFLKDTVTKIYGALKDTEKLCAKYKVLPDKITFIESKEFADKGMSPDDGEYFYAKKYGAIFVSQIGYAHGSRAFDYDDWTLNGDLIVYDGEHDRAIELSSMGIRVDAQAMIAQHKHLGLPDSRMDSDYHRGILSGTLPQTIGGGIGQSRVAMFLLGKKSISEVQALQ